MTTSCTLVVNGHTYFHHYREQEVPSHFDLLAWLSQAKKGPKLYWKCREGGFEVAAIGSLLTLNQPPEFGSANDSPAVFWGGHSFFPEATFKDPVWKGFPQAAFFLPEIEIIRTKITTKALLHSLGGPIVEEIDLSPAYFSEAYQPVELEEHSPSSDDWTSFIQKTLKEIETAQFSKVVTARRSTLKGSVNPFELLKRLKAPRATFFALQFEEDKTFVGASPERLYLREGTLLFSEAIAGTRKRGVTEEEDRLLEQDLLENEKERREFSFVKDSIEEGLSPLCTSLSHQETDSVLKTSNVQHLYNRFTGMLKDSISDGDILKALHPTAAMGGLPKKSALEYIALHEPFERGWYASPVGFASQKAAEFVVGIRSALIEKEKVHLFAGTGIVQGSSPAHEWEELQHKTALWNNVLP